jgi:hypothetical protein
MLHVAREDLLGLVPDVGSFQAPGHQEVRVVPGVGGEDGAFGHHGGHHQLHRAQQVVGGAHVSVAEDLAHGLLESLEVPGPAYASSPMNWPESCSWLMAPVP